LRFVSARLRVAAAIGFAVATLLTVIPSAFAASPVDVIPSSVGGANSLALVPTASSPTPPIPLSAAARVIADAKSHLGARYVHGPRGPRVFDCSGLVLRVYADAGLVRKLGGWSNGSGYAIYAYGRRHHLTSRHNGQPGDVVVWGGGSHVGIYLGHGRAISALVNGVRVHGIYQLTTGFTAFIHTGLNSIATASATTAPKNARWTKVSTHLRVQPNVGAHTLRTLSSGTRVLVLRSIRDSHRRVWYQVTVGGRTGWVAGWLTER